MSGRSGFALVYTLFLVMALSLVGLGLLATGTTEAAIAAAVQAQANARARAEAAALTALDDWSTAAFDTLPIGAGVPLPPRGPGASAVTVVRVDTGLYLVRAEASHRQAIARAGLLVRVVPVAAAMALVPAALVALERVEILAGGVDGEDPCGEPRAGAQAPSIRVAPSAVVNGQPPVLLAPAPAPPAPDPFAPDAVAALATITPRPGAVAPRPITEASDCMVDDRNWGALDPTHPCHPFRPLIHVPGSLRMLGGEGYGILVVEGDAVLSAGARFRGLLVVRGELRIEDGSLVEGAVRSGAAVIAGGRVTADRCALSTAFEGGPLDRPFRPPGRWWIPQF